MGVRILPSFFQTNVNAEVVLTILYSVFVIWKYFNIHSRLQCGWIFCDRDPGIGFADIADLN